MTAPSTQEITQLLLAWGDGDQAALAKLVPLIEAELHRLAQHYLRHERPDHPLQTTALVNEVYVRLIDWHQVRWQNRAHFFGVSAQLMRRVLVDFARRRLRGKRKGELHKVPLDEALVVSSERSADLVAVDEALTAMASLDPRKARIVELRFFGGLTVEETAEVLKVSPSTVMREWEKAKSWLYHELLKGR